MSNLVGDAQQFATLLTLCVQIYLISVPSLRIEDLENKSNF